MAALTSIFRQKFTVNVAVVGVVETVIATLGGVDTRTPTSIITLVGWAQITPGSDQTSVALAIRRDSVSGALVGEANAVTYVAGAAQIRDQIVITDDAPGDVASQVYVLTALQAGGVNNGSALQGYLAALLG